MKKKKINVCVVSNVPCTIKLFTHTFLGEFSVILIAVNAYAALRALTLFILTNKYMRAGVYTIKWIKVV